jgi:hypothetical protein
MERPERKYGLVMFEGFVQALWHLVLQAEKQPRTADNYEKFLLDLRALLRKADKGDQFPGGAPHNLRGCDKVSN